MILKLDDRDRHLIKKSGELALTTRRPVFFPVLGIAAAAAFVLARNSEPSRDLAFRIILLHVIVNTYPAVSITAAIQATGVWFLSRPDWLLPNMLALPGRTMS